MELLAGLITFGLTAVLTIAGLGAAFILSPVFMAMGVELHTAMTTALLLNALSMSVASVTFVRRRLVVWRLGVPILLVAAALAPLGAHVSLGLDKTILLWLFVGFLVFASAMMLFYAPKPREVTSHPGVLVGAGIGVGGIAGFFGGLLGVGGGNFVVPALVAFGLDPKKASATTAFVVIFASFTGFLAHLSLAGVDWSLLGWTTAGSLCGAALGANLMSERLKSRQVKVIMGIVLLMVAAKMASNLM